MPSDGEQPEFKGRKGRLIDGTAPRGASPKAWNSNKPPGGKLPPKEKTE